MKRKFWQKTVSVFLGLTLLVSLFANTGNQLAANSLKTLTAVWNNTNVTLNYSGDEVPEGAILHVESVDEQTEANAKEQIQSMIEDEVDTTSTVVLSLLDTAGNQISPTGKVTVSFEGEELNNISNVYTNDGTTFTQVDAEINETTVSFDTDTLGTYSFVTTKEAEATETQTTEETEKPEFVGNSNMFAARYFPHHLIDLDGENINQETYENLKNEADRKLSESNKITIEGNKTIQNIPITWKRSSNSVTLSNKVGDEIEHGYNKEYYEGWDWNDVSSLNTSFTTPSSIWDGSRLNEYNQVVHNFNDSGYLSSDRISAYVNKYNTDNAEVGLYDSATWKLNGNVSINRFQGNFSLENLGEDLENIENIDFTLSQVTNDDNLYINDDIYVFIYPKGTEINNDNYLKYLSFWTGTVLQNRNEYNSSRYSFHGIPGANIEQLKIQSSEGFKRVTNGWKMKSVTDNIGGSIINLYKTTEKTDYVIDIFTEDYNTGGGMYRFKLSATSPTTRKTYSFTKVDENNKGLDGAEFTLYGTDGNQYVTKSENGGKVTIIAHPGTYTMKETKAPNGYKKSDNEWTVNLNENAGDIYITAKGTNVDNNAQLDGSSQDGWVIKNKEKITGSLSFDKVDEKGYSLHGAKFALYDEEDTDFENPLYEATSNNLDGKVKFSNILAKDYVLKEISAPNGYAVSKETWNVKANINGENVTFTITDNDGKSITEIKNEKQKLEDIIDMNKTANLNNWDDRTYTIHLDATSISENSTITTSAGDIVLVLDYSISMRYYTQQYISQGVYSRLDITRYKDYYYKNSSGNYIKASNQYNYEEKKCILKDANGNELKDDEIVYTREYKTRKDVLEESVKTFINDLKVKSPNSRVSIVPFCGNEKYTNSYTLGFKNVGTESEELINHLNELSLQSGTQPHLGLNKANDLFENDTNPNENHVILFTDGEPNHGYSDDAETSATALKNANITVHTIAAADSNRNWLDKLASTDCAHSSEDMSNLADIFDDILSSITTGSSITGATIKDYIDPRFDVLVEKNGEMIAAKDGDHIANGGTVHIKNGQTWIEWTDQTINYKLDENKNPQIGWEREFVIKAKEDFLGGNMVPTNGVESGITVGKETVKFEQPTVNVKPLKPFCKDIEITKILGQNIKTWDEVISKLTKYDNMLNQRDYDTLKNGNVVTKDYSYPGTNDVVGKLTFTLSENDGNYDDHIAQKVSVDSNPVEKYTLTITYTPKTVEERNTQLTGTKLIEPNKTFGSTNVAMEEKCTGIGKVYVKAGQITINKTIDEFDKTGGDPIFTNKITCKSNGETKVLYRTVRFTTDADMSKQVAVIDNLPVGEYTVEELPSIKYVLSSITHNNTSVDNKANFEIKDENTLEHEICFENNLEESNTQTDKDVVVNSVKIVDGKVVISQDWLNGKKIPTTNE